MVVKVANIVCKREVKQHSDRVDVDLASVLFVAILVSLGEASTKVHGPDVEGRHDDLLVRQHRFRLLRGFRR